MHVLSLCGSTFCFVFVNNFLFFNFLQFLRLSLAEAFEGEECNNFLSFLAMRHYVGPHHDNLRLTIITPAILENS